MAASIIGERSLYGERLDPPRRLLVQQVLLEWSVVHPAIETDAEEQSREKPSTGGTWIDHGVSRGQTARGWK
jgi:hypothetical protein